MSRKQCEYAARLVDLIRKGEVGREISAHIRRCPECNAIYQIQGILNEMSRHDLQNANTAPPSFESLWETAFSKEVIPREKIERAMRPIRMADMVSRIVFLATAIFIFILMGPGLLETVRDAGFIRVIDGGFIKPFIRIFNSSPFVSIPMTLTLISFFAYFLTLLIKPLTRKPLQHH